jgi:hypothetical protein
MNKITLNLVTKGIIKILVGTPDNEDGNYSSDKINSLETVQLDFLKIYEEQIIAVKSVLRSLKSNLFTVSGSERLLTRELRDKTKHINKQDGDVKSMFTASSMMFTVNKHSMPLNRTTDEYSNMKFETMLLLIRKGSNPASN